MMSTAPSSEELFVVVVVEEMSFHQKSDLRVGSSRQAKPLSSSFTQED